VPSAVIEQIAGKIGEQGYPDISELQLPAFQFNYIAIKYKIYHPDI
jgi:hypothetical protein